MVAMLEKTIELTDRQDEAWDVLSDPNVDDILYGGAKGGGKSFELVVWAYSEACRYIELFNLQPTDNPIHVGWIGRKQAVDFKGTTLATWRKIIPSDMYELKGGSDKEVTHILIAGTIAIDYGGLDSVKAVEKFNSAEYAFVCVDQAEETTLDDIAVLTASLRLKINDTALNYKAFYTANPRQCWLKNYFILNPGPTSRFIQALPSDNPHLPETYIARLKKSFGHRPELLEAYLNGKWDSFEGADQVILQRWLGDAKQRNAYVPFIKEFLVCDTARYGDDNTVIFHMINADIEDKWSLPKTPSTEISNRLAILSHQYDNCQIVVESIGSDVGAAVIDELIALGREVIQFNPAGETSKYMVVGTTPAGKEIRKKLYGNLRGEAWSEAAIKLQTGILDKESGMPLCCPGMYERLENQLITPRYKFLKGKVLIEEKAEIKKPERLGESPDDADTYIISLWAWDKIDKKEDRKLPHTLRDAYRTKQGTSAMAG